MYGTTTGETVPMTVYFIEFKKAGDHALSREHGFIPIQGEAAGKQEDLIGLGEEGRQNIIQGIGRDDKCYRADCR